jgi:hypothetical protein
MNLFLSARLCRPGSIVGPQQQYLASVEDRLVAEGIAYIQRVRNEVCYTLSQINTFHKAC